MDKLLMLVFLVGCAAKPETEEVTSDSDSGMCRPMDTATVVLDSDDQDSGVRACSDV